jgi:hypothetical protein
MEVFEKDLSAERNGWSPFRQRSDSGDRSSPSSSPFTCLPFPIGKLVFSSLGGRREKGLKAQILVGVRQRGLFFLFLLRGGLVYLDLGERRSYQVLRRKGLDQKNEVIGPREGSSLMVSLEGLDFQ